MADGTEEVFLEVKIVVMDYYRARPDRHLTSVISSLDTDGHISRMMTDCRTPLPVIRVFGVTPGGQHMCVHLHGCFPYLYVKVDASHVDEINAMVHEKMSTQYASAEERYVHIFKTALDTALCMQHSSDRPRKQKGLLEKVVDVQLVKGFPFYGYHKNECLWMKVYMYDPADVKRCANLLSNGAVLGKKFQPHESHIPYLLQLKIDYNLYGMGWLRLRRLTFRNPVSSRTDVDQGERMKRGGWIHRKAVACFSAEDTMGTDGGQCGRGKVWSAETIGSERLSMMKKQTTCELECDALVSDILNIEERKRVDITTASRELQLVDSLAPIWDEERKRQGKHDINPSPTGIDRNVEQIDPDTVNVWREKFRDAEQRRQPKSDTSRVVQETISYPSANDILGSQMDKEIHLSEPFDASAGFASLIDENLIEACLTTSATALDDWGDRQRELGNISQRHAEEASDQLLELANMLPKVSNDQNALDLFMLSPEMPSQFEIGRIAETARIQDARDIESECRDITEASQHFANEINKYANIEIPQVDGTHDEAEDQVNRKDKKAVKLTGETSSSYVPREKVREAGLRLSQIKEIFFGTKEIRKESTDFNSEGNIKPLSPAQEKTCKSINSQDVLDFWSEPVSQFVMDEFVSSDNDSDIQDRLHIFQPNLKPPSKIEMENSWDEYGLLPIVHKGPHFSNPDDIGKRCQVFGGKTFHFKTSDIGGLPLFSPRDCLMGKIRLYRCSDKEVLVYQNPMDPPSWLAVKQWADHRQTLERSKVSSQNDQSIIMMDSNTGKMLLDGFLSQDSLIGTPLLPSFEQRCNGNESCLRNANGTVEAPNSEPESTMNIPFRPSSPKYDEGEEVFRDIPSHEGNVVSRGAKTQRMLSPCGHKAKYGRTSISQISAPSGSNGDITPESQIGFKLSSSKGEGVTLIGIEIHTECRQGLLPDPHFDQVKAIVLSVFEDDEIISSGQYYTRIIMIKQHEKCFPNFEGLNNIQFNFVDSEKDLFCMFKSSIICLDPDILVGFEIQKDSIGYLADRDAFIFDNTSLLSDISRVPNEKNTLENMVEHDQYGWQHDSGLHVTGRVVLNLWRIVRAEVKLSSYSFENCVASILKLRVPCIRKNQLHEWFRQNHSRWRCLSHIALRTRLCLHMLEQLNFVGRTAELARTFGIDFFSVISRGSQYRVESMMIRLARSQNYIVLSPNNEQVARQPAMEALPLVMEPESGMYEDPVCVLDFQSLYPSMIIAYNLCFSTCVGRPVHIFSREGDGNRLGCLETFKVDHTFTEIGFDVKDLIIAPNGVGFVPADCRRGVLPRLLHEILETRIMVKKAMKDSAIDAKPILRTLNAKQFALKLIANVTYGYTAAGFSGRMPMAELADAIVQSGRETLESSIRFIRDHPSWKADVIYGDTDSIFVRLPGRSVADAYTIGQEIARAITARNPDPVLLKLEKVYHPCFLLSKKRYVGAMYESPVQMKFQFDAKGIETVRRDSCPAVAKIVEQSLRILFTSSDISLVRKYVERQWKRIMSGRISVKDFIFCKEVRLGTYSSSSSSSIPPAALVATKAMAQDPRAEPRFGERVPYVVVHGEPGARLIDMVMPPEALVESGGKLRLHAIYYITKQIIPSLERFLRLIGVDVRLWFSQMPKLYRHLPQKRPISSLPIIDDRSPQTVRAHTIDTFYLSRHCVCCDGLTMINRPFCAACEKNPQLVAAVLPSRLNRIERQQVHIGRICTNCGGGLGSHGSIACESLDCGIYFERKKVYYERQTAMALVHMTNISL